jgi:hypothetical protein
MIQCEDRLRAGMRAAPDASFDNWFLSRLLNNVGRIHEAAELARLSLAHDQYMPYKISHALRVLEATAQTDEAAKIYRQSTVWWPANDDINWERASGMAERGDFDALQHFREHLGGRDKPSPVLLAINRKSLPAVRTACSAAKEFDAVMCMLALARLGDFDAAFALTHQIYPSRRGRTPAEEERIWLDSPAPMPLLFLTGPAAASLRRDPRYLALAERVGLVEYWRSGRLPDFCRQAQPEPICSRLPRP